jgi:hypothetical protein
MRHPRRRYEVRSRRLKIFAIFGHSTFTRFEFQFSTEETAMNDKKKKQLATELSAEELESVTGGLTYTYASAVKLNLPISTWSRVAIHPEIFEGG